MLQPILQWMDNGIIVLSPVAREGGGREMGKMPAGFFCCFFYVGAVANKQPKLSARTGERIYLRSSEILPRLYPFHTQWGAYASIHVSPCFALPLALLYILRPRGVRLSEAQAACCYRQSRRVMFKNRLIDIALYKMGGCVAHSAPLGHTPSSPRLTTPYHALPRLTTP